MAQVERLIDKFYSGIIRDDKSTIPGSASNVEELDIFSNEDYIIPEQIFSADSVPASTEIYTYTPGTNDTVYGYGKETSGNQVRLVSVSSGGADNPGSFSTLSTASNGSDVAYDGAPCAFFETDESNTNYVYYFTNASGTIKLYRYDITGDSHASVGTLSGLDGSFDRLFLKEMFGELMVSNGQFIAKVDKDGVFTEKAFTLPNGWEAVDIIPVSDVGLILSRNKNRLTNKCKGYWWDLTSSLQVDDSFNVPMGGPQWIVNHKETIKFLCALNGTARIFQLSGAFPGAIPIELPNIRIDNVADETSTQPISAPYMVDEKDRILYFNLYKTDKTGLYALGQLDNNKPNALVLSKRFHTTDYSNHTPYGLLIQGSNFYAAFDDDGTASNARCETNNSPARSSNAVYESVWIDDDEPQIDKKLETTYLLTYPLPASTSLTLSVDSDYSGSYTAVTRADGTNFNTTSGILGYYRPASFNNKKVLKFKVAFTSNSTDAIKLTAIGFRLNKQDEVKSHAT